MLGVFIDLPYIYLAAADSFLENVTRIDASYNPNLT